VHILCRMSKNISTSELLKELKIESSKWIKKQYEDFGFQLSKFSWQGGYGVFSVSASQVDKVKGYIANQKKHHLKIGYKDEYLALLHKYNIEYDEKYLWN
jgi:putative transposase